MSKTLPLLQSGDVDLVCETGERVTSAGQLVQPLNRDRQMSLLGSSELASKVMVASNNNIDGWWSES